MKNKIHPQNECYCIQGSMIGRTDANGPQGGGINDQVAFTLNATDRHAVFYIVENEETENDSIQGASRETRGGVKDSSGVKN